MPAKSEKQRRLMAIAEHHPQMVSKKNRGVLSMSKSQLHDFASTKGKTLPKQVSKMGHNKKFMNKRGDHTSVMDHKWQGMKGGISCL